MDLFEPAERRRAEAIRGIVYCNPFTKERAQWERLALEGLKYTERRPYQPDTPWEETSPNHNLLGERAGKLAAKACETLRNRRELLESEDLAPFADLALYVLYDRVRPWFVAAVDRSMRPEEWGDFSAAWSEFGKEHKRFFFFVKTTKEGPFTGLDPSLLFAGIFQVERAFKLIFEMYSGNSKLAEGLRARVWESIFTSDMRLYRAGGYREMANVTTLITGETGTGKELVAGAIGQSQLIPFDPRKKQFILDDEPAPGPDGKPRTVLYHATNLSALVPGLIESELFGHKKGSFSGAISDRVGPLEECSPHGAVFLDEIGEVNALIQVKLLRVLQGRTFQRVGETTQRRFVGKIIAATNRGLEAAMHRGRFRRDFYFRLCSDRVRTPTLTEQLENRDEDLDYFVEIIARKSLSGTGEEFERQRNALVEGVTVYIRENLKGYGWPGNFRELEQCFRSVMIHRSYEPQHAGNVHTDGSVIVPGSCKTSGGGPVHTDERRPAASFLRQIRTGIDARNPLNLDELIGRYSVLVLHRHNGDITEAAGDLGIDRRTLKGRLKRYFEQVLDRHRKNVTEVAGDLGIDRRTLEDWLDKLNLR